MSGHLINPLNNILLRWVGIRLVSHLPCSHECKATEKIARSNVELGKKLGYGNEINEIIELLSMPIRYSALHGIAEITTPFCKIMTRTDATKTEWKLRTEDLSKVYTLNGFKSFDSMEAAHQNILNAIGHCLPSDLIMDLGCGNGLLLRKIKDIHKCMVVGVDTNREAAKFAHDNYNIEVMVADIKEYNEWAGHNPLIILLSYNRIKEGFILHPDTVVGSVILYSYDNDYIEVPDGWDCYYRTDNYICLRKR